MISIAEKDLEGVSLEKQGQTHLENFSTSLGLSGAELGTVRSARMYPDMLADLFLGSVQEICAN